MNKRAIDGIYRRWSPRQEFPIKLSFILGFEIQLKDYLKLEM